MVAAFENVVGARQEAEAKIRQAEGYAAATRTLAEGQAFKTVREAESYKAERVAVAEAQAAQFKNQLLAYQAAPEVYLNRAYMQLWLYPTNSRLYVVTSTNSHNVYQVDLQDKIIPDMATGIPIPEKK